MSTPITVLYVEDDEDIRDVAEMALEGDDFVLLTCDCGNQALEKGALASPDLLLLDVMMPTWMARQPWPISGNPTPGKYTGHLYDSQSAPV